MRAKRATFTFERFLYDLITYDFIQSDVVLSVAVAPLEKNNEWNLIKLSRAFQFSEGQENFEGIVTF